MKEHSTILRLYLLEKFVLSDCISMLTHEDQLKLIQDDINLKVRAHYNRIILRFNNAKVTTHELLKSKILTDLLLLQMYSDYYMLEKLDGNKNVLKENYESLKKKFIDENYAAKLISSSIIVLDMPDCERVLLQNKLTDDDNEYLSKINCFYEEEKEKYEKGINLEFIYRELECLMDSFENEELTFFYMSAFIFELNKDKPNISKRLIKDMINYVSADSYIVNYDADKDTIDIDGKKIDEDILCKILFDYYYIKKTEIENHNSNNKILT